LNEKHQIIPTIKAAGGQVSQQTKTAGGSVLLSTLLSLFIVYDLSQKSLKTLFII